MSIALEFTSSPAVMPSMKRAFFGSRPRLKRGESLPEITATWKNAKADLNVLNAYRKACDQKNDGYLPILFPNVFTFTVQMEMLTHPAFPIKVLGGVHASQHVIQYRPIKEDESVDYFLSLGESQVVKAGLEFDMITKVMVKDELVWESRATYLTFGKFGEPVEGPKVKLPDLTDGATSVEWRVPGDMGKRYAKISRDFNPIHLHWLTAKIFSGFKFPKAIIHGMWSAASCVGHLDEVPGDGPLQLDIAFKGPVFMGSKIAMKVNADDATRRFDLFCGKNPRPCVCGLLQRKKA